MIFTNIAAVLFDLDGTLVDSAPDLGGAVDQMRTDRGLASLPFECYRPMAGAGARGMLGVAFGVNPQSPGYDALRDEFFDRYERRLNRQTLAFEGISEVIRILNKKNILWGVVTNKATRFTNPLTSAMPLFATAKAIVSGDTTPHAKPHPAPLLEAARRLGVSPTHCVYVGDDERDVVAGNAAGMYTVAATYGYLGSKTDASTWGAHGEINSPSELLQLLASA
jgi:N-acetyl-D-muramate 6-phosphate phosphatase